MSPSPSLPVGPVLPEQVAALQDVSLRLTRRLRKHSQTDLTLSQMSALSTLQRVGAMRVGELARREQISKSSVTRLVAKLDDMGYLSREVDPTDGRSSTIDLTPYGHELLDEAKARANDFLAAEVAQLPKDEQRAILASLPALQHLVAPKLAAREPDEAATG